MIPSEVKDTIWDALHAQLADELEKASLYVHEREHYQRLASETSEAIAWLSAQEVEPCQTQTE